MNAKADEATHAGALVGAPFATVLCGVDGSRGSREAIRQAVALAEPDGAVTFLAVFRSIGAGLTEQALLSEARAGAALKRAAAVARGVGVSAQTELRQGKSAGEILLAEAADHDLLALGSRGIPRHAGIVLGATTSRAAHRAERPVLVARRSHEEGPFPRTILLASDGSAGSWAAAKATSRIARARGSEVEVVYVPDGVHPERYRELTRQVAEIEADTGSAPQLSDAPGHVAARILEVAEADPPSLIVIGHGGRKGLHALGSVSERVVHRAPCSVLVVHGDGDEPRQPAA